jgi:hypothetical protein
VQTTTGSGSRAHRLDARTATRSGRIRSSSDTSPASDSAAEGTPAGTAQPAMRSRMDRRSTPAARRLRGPRLSVSPRVSSDPARSPDVQCEMTSASSSGDQSTPTLQQFYLPNESARSVRVEMVYCPSGPDTSPELGRYCRTLAFGSAFIYDIDNQLHLVTARHNLTGRHWQTNACLGQHPVEPTHLRVALLAKPPENGWPLTPSDEISQAYAIQMRLQIMLLALIEEDWQPKWKQHPTLGPDMDVATLPLNITDDQLLLTAWPSSSPDRVLDPGELRWPELGAGQDVFVVGYPDALTTGPLFPLWIRGTIASEPRFGYSVGGRDLPLMLVDARTRRGQSGSAVMRHRAEGTMVNRVDGRAGVTDRPHSELAGVYSGRTSDESDLGYVWRMDEVDVICRDGVRGVT